MKLQFFIYYMVSRCLSNFIPHIVPSYIFLCCSNFKLLLSRSVHIHPKKGGNNQKKQKAFWPTWSGACGIYTKSTWETTVLWSPLSPFKLTGTFPFTSSFCFLFLKLLLFIIRSTKLCAKSGPVYLIFLPWEIISFLIQFFFWLQCTYSLNPKGTNYHVQL